jgi:hypothetical protein
MVGSSPAGHSTVWCSPAGHGMVGSRTARPGRRGDMEVTWPGSPPRQAESFAGGGAPGHRTRTAGVYAPLDRTSRAASLDRTSRAASPAHLLGQCLSLAFMWGPTQAGPGRLASPGGLEGDYRESGRAGPEPEECVL